ncbi:hypothetical protein RHMOL_Rhmol05G0095200 [Rhododendron molle]|uniref:Uncharacterized protein n=1 Tax=Rhododendron molle TaxID=49168 RepID=A0ACC0NPG8_RHOML|nr:hypothetical protein RHMOL_Rhmol05G0095200 [Rhododendron molle]
MAMAGKGQQESDDGSSVAMTASMNLLSQWGQTRASSDQTRTKRVHLGGVVLSGGPAGVGLDGNLVWVVPARNCGELDEGGCVRRSRREVYVRFGGAVVKDPSKLSPYRDRRFPGTQEEFEHALQTATTVYVGNMSFYTTEEQVYELFSRAGEIKKIIMGLDKNTKTPCGFCFVLYYSREDAEDAVKYISGTILDDRPIRVDFDWGFQEGRQWGRGRSGGQVRDEYRTDYDPDIL